MDFTRSLGDPHSGPVSPAAWEADAEARKSGRVEMFNATRPDGLDGWTMPIERYCLLRNFILGALDHNADNACVAVLEGIIQAAKEEYLGHPAFRHAKVRNLATYVVLDLQARCEIISGVEGRSVVIARLPLSQRTGARS